MDLEGLTGGPGLPDNESRHNSEEQEQKQKQETEEIFAEIEREAEGDKSNYSFITGGNGNGDGNGNGKASSSKAKAKQKDKPQISIFKYSARFRKPLREAILLNDEPVFLMWSEENERLITVTHIEENNRVLRPPCIEEYPYEPVEFGSVEEIKEYAGLALHYIKRLRKKSLCMLIRISRLSS